MDRLSEIIGVIIPMLTIAGSSVAYIIKIYKDGKEKRQNYFLSLMALIDGAGTMAGKLAAIYQLRMFPEHKEFIIRFCDNQRHNLSGSTESVRILSDELEATMEFFKK